MIELHVRLWPSDVLMKLETSSDAIIRQVQAVPGVLDVARLDAISRETLNVGIVRELKKKERRALPRK